MGLIGFRGMILATSLLLLASCLTSCQKEEIAPKIAYSIHESQLKKLPSPFEVLQEAERKTDWGREYTIGRGFGKKLDFYRAITALERAELLLPEENVERKREIEYQVLLSYYLGKRHNEVIHTFEAGSLKTVSSDFAPYRDLLVILYDSYLELGMRERAYPLLGLIHNTYPETYERLLLSTALKDADFEALETFGATQIVETYRSEKKSKGRAQLFNGILPGLGYFYLGQTHTAITALLCNALFFAATFYFFRRRAIAAALIFLGFSIGWYVGGIQGAATQTKIYNERLYETMVIQAANREGHFPIFQLQYGF